MRRSKPFHPADYNLAANPSLARTNSPWGLFGALAAAGLACFVAWHVLRGPVRVSRPTLEFLDKRIIAIATVVNETDHSVRLSVRILLGRASSATDEVPAAFNVIAHRDVAILVQARSTDFVRCEFPLPPPEWQSYKQLQAEILVLSRQ